MTSEEKKKGEKSDNLCFRMVQNHTTDCAKGDVAYEEKGNGFCMQNGKSGRKDCPQGYIQFGKMQGRNTCVRSPSKGESKCLNNEIPVNDDNDKKNSTKSTGPNQKKTTQRPKMCMIIKATAEDNKYCGNYSKSAILMKTGGARMCMFMKAEDVKCPSGMMSTPSDAKICFKII